MKKITAASRVIELFSTQPIEVCEGLLDIAQSILKQRRGTAPKKARKTKTPEPINDRHAPIPPRSPDSGNPGRGDA